MTAGCIVGKDLRLLMKDRRAFAILLAMPLVFIAVLGFSTGRMLGWQAENATLRLVVVDQTAEDAARDLVAALGERSGVEVITAERPEAACAAVDDGDRVAAVVIGSAFARRVERLGLADFLDAERGQLADGLASLDISIYVRPTRAMAGALTEQLVYAAALRALLPRVAEGDPLVRAYLNARAAEETPPDPDGARASSSTFGEYAGSDVDDAGLVYRLIVPGYTVMFAFFLINIMARSFVSERRDGTLLRLRAAPLRAWQIVVGKTVPFLMLSCVQGILLFLFGKVLFGMSWGPVPWMLLPVIVCTSLAATGLGLLTAVVVRTEAQVSAYANLLVITLAGISGCLMPREWLPAVLRKLSLATPHAWALIAYDQILVDTRPDVGRILACCTALVAFSALFFLCGWHRFRSASTRC